MRIVHLIQRPGDVRAWDAAVRHRAAGHDVAVILLQDAVLDRPEAVPAPPAAAGEAGRGALAVVAGAVDLAARGLSGRWPALDDGGIVDLLYEAERVISW